MTITRQISIPADLDGYILLKCPYCKEFFKLKASDINAEEYYKTWCPSCGLIADDYLIDEVYELAENMAMNIFNDLIFDELNKMSKKVNRNNKYIKLETGKKPKALPENPIKSRIDLLEIQTYKCCNKKLKISPLVKFTVSYCPFCGRDYDEYR